MVVGTVFKQAVPMYIGYDEEMIKMLTQYLEESLIRGNNYMALFGEYDYVEEGEE